MIKLYGIKNCDSVKKAQRWLQDNQQPFAFHDFRVEGLDAKTLAHWCQNLGWKTLLNTKSTTWRQLPDDIKRNASAHNAAALMLAHPTLIKRPVLVTGEDYLVGFDANRYHQLFNSN